MTESHSLSGASASQAFWVVLFNPGSRRGRARTQQARELMATHVGLHRTRVAWVPLGEMDSQEIEAPDRLVVIGGDGTVNAGCEWRRRRGWNCPLAILPAGTGNNLARALGIPLHLPAALDVAVGSERRPLDAVIYGNNGASQAGDSTERLLVQTGAFGFPAEIASEYDRWRRHFVFRWFAAPMGTYIYRVLAFFGMARQKRRERRGENLLRLHCAAPEGEWAETAFAVFVGNEASLGGNFHPCPRAEIDDGKLDICVVRAGTGAAYLKLFRAICRGQHLEMTDTIRYEQTSGPVELEFSEPLDFLADGDLWTRGTRWRLSVEKHAVQLVVPQKAKKEE